MDECPRWLSKMIVKDEYPMFVEKSFDCSAWVSPDTGNETDEVGGCDVTFDGLWLILFTCLTFETLLIFGTFERVSMATLFRVFSK